MLYLTYINEHLWHFCSERLKTGTISSIFFCVLWRSGFKCCFRLAQKKHVKNCIFFIFSPFGLPIPPETVGSTTSGGFFPIRLLEIPAPSSVNKCNNRKKQQTLKCWKLLRCIFLVYYYSSTGCIKKNRTEINRYNLNRLFVFG